jgi:hypothetical protein
VIESAVSIIIAALFGYWHVLYSRVTMRWTMDTLYLWEGLPIVPVPMPSSSAKEGAAQTFGHGDVRAFSFSPFTLPCIFSYRGCTDP